MNGQYLANRPIHVSYAYKKDGSKGERHGTQAERMLAAKRKVLRAVAAPAHMQRVAYRPRSRPLLTRHTCARAQRPCTLRLMMLTLTRVQTTAAG